MIRRQQSYSRWYSEYNTCREIREGRRKDADYFFWGRLYSDSKLPANFTNTMDSTHNGRPTKCSNHPGPPENQTNHSSRAIPWTPMIKVNLSLVEFCDEIPIGHWSEVFAMTASYLRVRCPLQVFFTDPKGFRQGLYRRHLRASSI